YDDYVTVKACYEIRQGYVFVWINDIDMGEAKRYMSEIDEKLALPDREEIWKKTESTYNGARNLLYMSANSNGLGPGGERFLCQQHLHELRDLFQNIVAPEFKKDF